METQTQAALFVGHGDPMMALRNDDVARTLRSIGERIHASAPKAILAISAHWFTRATFIQSSPEPKQIYDMYGFPPELYAITYHPSGCKELTRRVQDLLGSDVSVDDSWGIDHGVWTPLHHMLPKADIPVVELSVNGLRDARYAYKIGRRLAPLRKEGFLLMGSGNIVHNLRALEPNNPHGTAKAAAFSASIRDAVTAHDYERVLSYRSLPHASWAVPTPDHFLPLPTILGATQQENAEVYNDLQNLGSISMTSFAFGLQKK
jgi:4,5-DOPA dioxygenase extradiol